MSSHKSHPSSSQSPVMRPFQSPAGSLSSGRSSRLERHSLEVSATVFKDILIGNSAHMRQRHAAVDRDFVEIDELESRDRIEPCFAPTLKPFYACCSMPHQSQSFYQEFQHPGGHYPVAAFHSPPPQRMSMYAGGPNNSGSMYFSNLDLRQVSRPHSHSPAPKAFARHFGPNLGPAARLVSSAQNSPIRRYSPPQGSTGSGGKSPRTSLDGSGPSPDSPVSTSSPLLVRRAVQAAGKKSCTIQNDENQKRVPYYVAETANNISGSSSTHSWFNIASHSSADPSCSSDELKFEIPYVCPKSCHEQSSCESNPVFDDSMYRILPQSEFHVKMIPDRTFFQRRIECEAFGPYYPQPQGRDAGQYHPSCTACQHYYGPAIFNYENLLPNHGGPHSEVFPNYFRENNIAGNSSNNNFDESMCTSRLGPQQQHQTHLCDERAQCCCCCAALMTSHLEEDEERARETSKSAPAKSQLRAEDQCSDGQSGFESGKERSHCCTAQKLTTATTNQQCESLSQRNCNSNNNNSSFCSEDGKISSQPCGDRGRSNRLCSTGNKKCTESCDDKQCADKCCATKNGDVEKVSSHRESNSSSDMRLLKKCKDEGSASCVESEEERSFKSVPSEAGPRWSGLTGVPGLGASIHQIQKEENRDTVRWSAQSLHSLTSLKIDLPRVQNATGNVNNLYNGSAASSSTCKSSCSDKTFCAPNLPRVSQRKSLVATKSYGGPVHHGPDQLVFGSSPVDPLLIEPTRRRRVANDDRRRKTVAHFGPRSLPVGSCYDIIDIPRAPIATPADRGQVKTTAAPPVPDKKYSAPPLSLLPALPPERHEGTRSFEDQHGRFEGRNHPHRHSMGFLRSTVMSNRREDFCNTSTNVSFNVDSSVEESFTGNNGHYQSPRDRDGDYSYAYDTSVSPAFLIKWNGAVDDMYHEEESKTENIYEEIDKRVDENDVDNDELDDDFHEKGMSDGNSSRKSSSLNSDSGIGASGGSRRAQHRVVGKLGTLDVTQRGPYKKKDANHSNESQKSSLDVLLSQTTPGMTPHQRLSLRKSLVDELFEELIQRHHSRVLDQLRLDVEEFIAPQASQNVTQNEEQSKQQQQQNSSQNGSPFQRAKSTTASKLLIMRRDKSGKASVASRRSASSPRRLRKCESMDFKEILSSSGSASPASTKNQSNVDEFASSDNDAAKVKQRSPATTIFTSARKFSEAFHRKYFSRSSAARIKQQQQQQQQQQPSQVSRKGRRPLSAFLTRTSLSEVIGSGDEMDDSDCEEESARRLQRSKIIQSFLREQDNLEMQNNNNNNNSVSSASSKKH